MGNKVFFCNPLFFGGKEITQRKKEKSRGHGGLELGIFWEKVKFFLFLSSYGRSAFTPTTFGVVALKSDLPDENSALLNALCEILSTRSFPHNVSIFSLCALLFPVLFEMLLKRSSHLILLSFLGVLRSSLWPL